MTKSSSSSKLERLGSALFIKKVVSNDFGFYNILRLLFILTVINNNNNNHNNDNNHMIMISNAQQVQLVDDYSCDVENDTCSDKFDGWCDSEVGRLIDGCFGGDCFDCDLCKEFDFDCTNCINHGCYWCPGDATCSNSNLYISNSNIKSCTEPSHYVSYHIQANAATCIDSNNFFSDPYYSAQRWVYDLINVVPVWERGITGLGSRVRINDDSIDATNLEFADRFDKAASCTYDENGITGDDSISTHLLFNPRSSNFHATAVASLVAGGANNGRCAVGIAPDATLSACYAFTTNDSFLNYKLDSFDISQNSFGTDACSPIDHRKERERLLQQQECPFQYYDKNPTDSITHPCDVCDFTTTNINNDIISSRCEDSIIEHCTEYYENDPLACLEYLDLYIVDGECSYNILTDVQRDSIIDGITHGRNGKGIIYVFASGNAYKAGEDTNFEGLMNTRFTIPVGAVGKLGYHASYSTPGAALIVVGPGGDFEYTSNHIASTPSSDCTEVGQGTSFACPIVSGVIALVLQANPNLTWRDVQGILAKSSRMIDDDPDDDTRITNAAGITHSHLYGFGIVDANAAVDAALSWENYRAEQMIVTRSGILNVPIPPHLSTNPQRTEIISTLSVSKTNAIPVSEDFIVESVVVYLDVRHATRGDLNIILTSPYGTTSLLHPGKRPETTQLNPDGAEDEHWKLLTVRNWGESGIGDWTLSIQDVNPGNFNTCTDLPFFSLERDENDEEFIVDCDFFQRRGNCFDGAPFGDDDYVFSIQDEGLSINEACCECGGGILSSDFNNELVQWRLVLYGHVQGPTMAPSASPTGPPVSPTIPPINDNGSSSIGRYYNLQSLFIKLFVGGVIGKLFLMVML